MKKYYAHLSVPMNAYRFLLFKIIHNVRVALILLMVMNVLQKPTWYYPFVKNDSYC